MLAAEAAAIDKVAQAPGLAAFLELVRDAQIHCLRRSMNQAPILSSLQGVQDYLFAELAHCPREVFRVLYLNSANRLLRDELMSEGSTTATHIYPREVIRRALDLHATALILAHNHPSGDPQPSQSDIKATRDLIHAAAPFEIVVHDHLIVSSAGLTSFRALGLLA